MIFKANIALYYLESFCRYTNTFNRAITCVLRYENHIFSAQAPHSHFEMKLFFLVFCGKKLTGMSTTMATAQICNISSKADQSIM